MPVRNGDDVRMSAGEYERLKADADANKRDARIIRSLAGGAVVVLMGLVALGMWGCPSYNVWSKEMSGKAQLSEAEYSKQIQIQEANANLEAEKLNAQAEVERAKGAAEARQQEGLGMTTEEYIQYLWVKKLSLAGSSIIYLPTDGGLPVLTQDATSVPAVSDQGNADVASEQQE